MQYFSSERLLPLLAVIILLSGLLESSPRHDRKRFLSERKLNKTYEGNYKKTKKNLVEMSKDPAGSGHPLCQYPNLIDMGPKSKYYLEFYRKACSPPSLQVEPNPPSALKVRSIRNSRRSSKKKNGLSSKKKKKIDKLLKKSMCRTLKTMVPVEGPYENEEFFPCKILVKRCAGCCLSQLEECVPTKTKIRKFNVLRSSQLTNQSTYRAKIEEHIKCECRCKVKASDCGPGQIYEEDNCLCKCPQDSHTTCHQSKRWSERDCKCVCKKERDCSTGMTFNPDTCLCEQQHYLEEFVYEEFS